MDQFILFSFVLSVKWILLPVLAAIAVVGVVALVSPRQFAAISQSTSKWVDTNRLADLADRRFDIDHLVIRYCRVFGVLIVLASLVLGYLVWVFAA